MRGFIFTIIGSGLVIYALVVLRQWVLSRNTKQQTTKGKK